MSRNISWIVMILSFVFIGCRENWHTTMVELKLAQCFVDQETMEVTVPSGGICKPALKEYVGESEVLACLVVKSDNNRQICTGLWKPGGDIALEGCSSESGDLEELDTEGDKVEMQLFTMDLGVLECPPYLTIGTSCTDTEGCLFALRSASQETDFEDEKVTVTYGDTGDDKPCQPECTRSELCLAPGATVASCLNPEPAEGEGEGEGEKPPLNECNGCTNSPPNECDGEGNAVEYDSPGICVNGERCLYDEDIRPCRFGCADGKCMEDPCALGCEGEGEGEGPVGEGEGEGGEGEGQPDPCEDVVCEDPPVNFCDVQGDVVEFEPAGECGEGECSYDSIIIACQFGCEDAHCLPNPCDGVVCQGREPRCEDNILVTEVDGQCEDGICSYTIRREPDPLCAPQGEGEGEGPAGEGEGEGGEGEGEGPVGEGEGEGQVGEGEGEGQPDPCEGLLLCEEEQVTCDGPGTIVRCQLNADGCLVETREPSPEGWSCTPSTGPDGFLMGSPPDEVGRGDDEVQHQVVITRTYFAKQTEVTQAEWRTLMGNSPSAFGGCDTCPVETINWFDAIAYTNALSRAEGLEECYALGDASWPRGLDCMGYRLPTEAEWEYAARAGEDGPTYGPLDDIAWCAANSGGSTHPVCEKERNAWGLCDVIGDVWEYVWDIYGPFGPDDQTDPIGPDGGPQRTVRGGYWDNLPNYCRLAGRLGSTPSSAGAGIGFRVVRSIN